VCLVHGLDEKNREPARRVSVQPSGGGPLQRAAPSIFGTFSRRLQERLEDVCRHVRWPTPMARMTCGFSCW
jgi:hypothetical protein